MNLGINALLAAIKNSPVFHDEQLNISITEAEVDIMISANDTDMPIELLPIATRYHIDPVGTWAEHNASHIGEYESCIFCSLNI